MLVLLVEDDPAVQASVRRRLSFEGFSVETADRGDQVLQQVRTLNPDVVILDIMLPEMDGFEVAEQLRQHSDVPILMLTARDAVHDRIQGLACGADDYLVKPFAVEELLARIRALLRRASLAQPRASETLTCATLSLNESTREVLSDGHPVALTPREFSLLQYLLRHARQVLTRDQILEAVWGHDHLGDSNVIDVYVRQLREKLEAQSQGRLLHTVRGVGYTLRW
ncbi:MAG: response regulator transcription factor [Candidatus Eremiobacteraeota bacterium]|nr:response regulator transcription factor [Candidatus Eremiobacteraeota bacterium]